MNEKGTNFRSILVGLEPAIPADEAVTQSIEIQWRVNVCSCTGVSKKLGRKSPCYSDISDSKERPKTSGSSLRKCLSVVSEVQFDDFYTIKVRL